MHSGGCIYWLQKEFSIKLNSFINLSDTILTVLVADNTACVLLNLENNINIKVKNC